jgi:serine/threonine protein kinase
MAVIITPQPPGCSCDNLIGWGITGSVYYDERRKEVIKAPNSLEDRILIEVEKDIYERLLQYRGSQLFNENTLIAIRLEWAPNGQLDRFLRISHHNIDSNSRIRWISQLAGVLQYVHSKNVVHGDVSCHNILLDENLDMDDM